MILYGIYRNAKPAGIPEELKLPEHKGDITATTAGDAATELQMQAAPPPQNESDGGRGEGDAVAVAVDPNEKYCMDIPRGPPILNCQA